MADHEVGRAGPDATGAFDLPSPKGQTVPVRVVVVTVLLALLLHPPAQITIGLSVWEPVVVIPVLAYLAAGLRASIAIALVAVLGQTVWQAGLAPLPALGGALGVLGVHIAAFRVMGAFDAPDRHAERLYAALMLAGVSSAAVAGLVWPLTGVPATLEALLDAPMALLSATLTYIPIGLVTRALGWKLPRPSAAAIACGLAAAVGLLAPAFSGPLFLALLTAPLAVAPLTLDRVSTSWALAIANTVTGSLITWFVWTEQLTVAEAQGSTMAMVAIGAVVGVLFIGVERLRLARDVVLLRERQHLAVLSSIKDAVFIVNAAGMIHASNRQAEAVTGLSDAEMIGSRVLHPAIHWTDAQDTKLSVDPVTDAIAGDRAVKGMVLGLSRAGRGRVGYVNLTVQPLPADLRDDQMAATVTMVDITGQILAQRQAAVEHTQLRHRAMYDMLTGLPNRTALLDRLGQARARAIRNGTATAVLAIDLDGFKNTNDQLGHDAGDEVLVQVAVRLKGVLRESDTPARVGGDEFVVLCEALEVEDADVQLARLTDRVRAALRGTYVTSSGTTTVGATIGHSLAYSGQLVGGQLMTLADAELLRLKRREEPESRVLDQQSADPPDVVESTRRVRAMIVDDDASMRLLASRLLHSQPHRFEVVGEAADGEAAIPLILSTAPDVVLCDIMMPALNGVDIVRAVRESNPGQLFVFWSAAREVDLGKAVKVEGVPSLSKAHIHLLADTLYDVAVGQHVQQG